MCLVFCKKPITRFKKIPTWLLTYFLALPDAPCPSYVFPAPDLEAVISSRILGSFYWRWYLQSKPGCEVCSLLFRYFRPSWGTKVGSMCMCICICIYNSYLYWFLISKFLILTSCRWWNIVLCAQAWLKVSVSWGWLFFHLSLSAANLLSVIYSCASEQFFSPCFMDWIPLSGSYLQPGS